MADDRIEQLLSADHAALSGRLAARSPTAELVRRMQRRVWRKTLIVAIAALFGFAVACSQLPALAPLGPLVAIGAGTVIILVLFAIGFTLPDID